MAGRTQGISLGGPAIHSSPLNIASCKEACMYQEYVRIFIMSIADLNRCRRIRLLPPR